MEILEPTVKYISDIKGMSIFFFRVELLKIHFFFIELAVYVPIKNKKKAV